MILYIKRGFYLFSYLNEVEIIDFCKWLGVLSLLIMYYKLIYYCIYFCIENFMMLRNLKSL